MYFRVRELELQPEPFDQEFPAGKIDFGEELRALGPLRAEGRAEVLHETRDGPAIADIRVVGRYQTRVELRCARCLEPVERGLAADFDMLYRPLGVDARGEESSISEAETEIGYYKGDGLLLEDVLKELVLLAAPVKAVCRDDCKGLCPQCGLNLNQGQCSCKAQRVDARWAALQSVKDKLSR